MIAALIYTHTNKPRLKYLVDFLSHYYGQTFKLIFDQEAFVTSNIECKINYSFHSIDKNETWIHPHSLLFESVIRPVKTECFTYKSYKVFFKTEGDAPFDILAATFFLIARYEEYLPHKKDGYERYAHENSLAFREDFLHLPLVNIWLEDFRKILSTKNSQFSILHSPFKFLPTYDIDMAWSYRNKGFKRNAGAILKLIFSGKWKSVFNRIQVLRKQRPDPFDVYDWMDEIHQQYKLDPLYFFLVANHREKLDKNINIKNKNFQSLIKKISLKYKTGLHPSWASGDNYDLLPKEKKALQDISGQLVNLSRQHYIRFELPVTYQHLLNAGITHDYSMGYGSINGFRASIASSYYWYDLKNEEPTKLMIHPFCFMDANSFYEQKLNPEQALEEILHYHEKIKAINGTMITIWHNSFLGNSDEFEGWREVYEQFIATIATDLT